VKVYFLKLDTIYELHRYQLDVYGGIEGVRDQSLLHSALAMPESTFGGQFLHVDFSIWLLPIYFIWSRTIHSWTATSLLALPRPHFSLYQWVNGDGRPSGFC
jgi:hypothetical protein